MLKPFTDSCSTTGFGVFLSDVWWLSETGQDVCSKCAHEKLNPYRIWRTFLCLLRWFQLLISWWTASDLTWMCIFVTSLVSFCRYITITCSVFTFVQYRYDFFSQEESELFSILKAKACNFWESEIWKQILTFISLLSIKITFSSFLRNVV